MRDSTAANSSNERKPAVLRDRLGFSLRRHYVDQFHFDHVPSLPRGCRIIDLGGHKSKKRSIFDIRKYEYDVVGVNLTAEKGTDVVADVAEVQFADGSFDGAICRELREHVPDSSQTNYYGVHIAQGLKESDLHATCLLSWALALCERIIDQPLLHWNLIKP